GVDVALRAERGPVRGVETCHDAPEVIEVRDPAEVSCRVGPGDGESAVSGHGNRRLELADLVWIVAHRELLAERSTGACEEPCQDAEEGAIRVGLADDHESPIRRRHPASALFLNAGDR